jgi:hypothetical protein
LVSLLQGVRQGNNAADPWDSLRWWR